MKSVYNLLPALLYFDSLSLFPFTGSGSADFCEARLSAARAGTITSDT